MAEAFAAIGLASSIVAFVDFAQKVVSRLNEFSNDLKDGSNALVQIQTQLPVIIDGLRRIKERAESGKLDGGAKQALEPIVLACHRQVEVLSGIMDSVLPASDASKWERRKKAIQSLTADGKVKKASEILGQHLQTLTFYHSIGDSVAQSVMKKEFWLVPFDRNSNFVGRDSIFEEIDQAFRVSEGSQPKASLYGLGGIGKSQIALEYCFRKRHRQPTCSIFWVNAATVARFEESFQRMAKEFSLENGEQSQKDSLVSVKTWLESRFVEPWVMIIDNVDDEVAFFQDKCHNDKTPSQILPRCSHGQLLFTSRTRDMAFDLASPESPISVDVMATDEGLALLRKRLGPNPLDSHLIELLTELGHIPLAITQAISFIMKRRKSVEQYLELYRMGEKSMIRLLSHEFLDHGRQEQTMESVARTWQISFEWIQKNHPKAAECLCLMAFFQHHDVPDKLLMTGDPKDFDAFEFDESLSVLEAYSLLDVNKPENSCSTHRLIQVTTKLWLEQNGPARVEEWALRALGQVTRCFPDPHDVDKNDYWESCQSLLPHADIVLGQQFKISEREADLKKATLLTSTGSYISWIGSDPADERRRYKRSLDLRQRHLGSDHPETWLSMRKYFQLLASTEVAYPPDMDSNAVADMGLALLSRQRDVFGPRSPGTIQTMADMGRFLSKEEEFEESENTLREALTLSEEVQGHNNLVTVECMDNLANVLERMGRFEEALEIRKESAKVRAHLLGPDDRTVLTAKSNLACCLANTGRLDEAILIGREVMDLRRRILGPDHPKTLISARNLSIFFLEGRRYKEALDSVDHVLNILQGSQRVYYTESIMAQEFKELRLEVEWRKSTSVQNSEKDLEREVG